MELRAQGLGFLAEDSSNEPRKKTGLTFHEILVV